MAGTNINTGDTTNKLPPTNVTRNDVTGGSTTPLYTQAQLDQILASKLSDMNASNVNAVQVQARALAQGIILETENRKKLADMLAKNGKTMTRFTSEDIVSNIKTKISFPVWTGPTSSLSTMWTSSLQPSSSRQYYIGVYNVTQSLSTSEFQYAIAYGNYNGSGSIMTNGDSPSRAIYYQYRNILIADSKSKFQLGNQKQLNSVYIINIARNRIKDKLDPGNWELVVSGGTSIPVVKLIDDSNSNTSYTIGASGRVFNIVSGTVYNQPNAVPYYDSSFDTQALTYYGLVYPDLGIMVLDADALSASASFSVTDSTTTGVTGSGGYSINANKLFMAISGAAALSAPYAFAARSEEYITSTHYFVRVKNAEYNYSNNPTFVTGSTGDLLYTDFIDYPNVYVTTVGLYNDNNELLAVAKVSRPLLKNFDTETLVKIRLDF